MANPLRIATVVVAVLSAGACTETPLGPLAAGQWGGEHIGMVVTSSGASVEYDCAHGTIDVPIEIQDGGPFLATGTHTFEHGGPVREDEPPDNHPAEYRGRVSGGTMNLTVTLTDTTLTIGKFTLVRGGSPIVFKCL